MKQAQYSPMSVAAIAITLFAVDKGYYDGIAVKQGLHFEAELMSDLLTQQPELIARLNETGALSTEDEACLNSAIASFRNGFL
jgi:F-type H+-transporting ATPase subunit alpha